MMEKATARMVQDSETITTFFQTNGGRKKRSVQSLDFHPHWAEMRCTNHPTGILENDQ